MADYNAEENNNELKDTWIEIIQNKTENTKFKDNEKVFIEL